ncbi:MAG: extracellular solute-binding protein [Mycobacteriales bacterium]
MRSRSPAAVAATCLVLLATACGSSGGGLGNGRLAGTRITFSISVSAEEKPAIQALLSQFEHETKARVSLELLGRFRSPVGARVDLTTSISSTELVERLRLDERGGQPGIQLFAQDNLALKTLVDEGLVQDLSDVAVPAAVSASMLPPKFGGRQYFLPFRPNVRLTYLDRVRLERAGVRPPTTVAEFKAAAERLKAAAGRPAVTLSLAAGDPAAVTISEWIVSFGGDPLLLNDRGSQQAFAFLQSLWKEGVLARESLFGKYDTEVDNLESGTAWVAQNWPITSAALAKQGMLPRFSVYAGWKGPVRSVHVVGGDVLGIPNGITGRQKKAALALAEFLMSKKSQEYLVTHNAWPSIRDDAYSDVPKEQGETFSAIRTALKDGWFRPSVSYWPDVSLAMSEAVNRILLQYQPVQAVLDELHARVGAAARAKGAVYPPSR